MMKPEKLFAGALAAALLTVSYAPAALAEGETIAVNDDT